MVPTYTLNDGRSIPATGFGTYPLRGEDGIAAVTSAIEVGYRLLDTAVNYENEREVGEAIKRSGVPRDDLFVTSKLPGRHHGYDDAIRSTKDSLGRLGLDHLDLHLIHWPNPAHGLFAEAWRALVDLQRDGLVRSIGVSNFTAGHLHRIIDETGVTPAVNQIELHPYFQQRAVQALGAERGILTQAWSPIGGITFYREGEHTSTLEDPTIAGIAETHSKSPAQVMLRWHLQQGRSVIPKSTKAHRIAENFDVFDFELTADELAAIDALDTGQRGGPEPEAITLEAFGRDIPEA
jgi:diketogulonate reductase-like aldo/keto reductase